MATIRSQDYVVSTFLRDLSELYYININTALEDYANVGFIRLEDTNEIVSEFAGVEGMGIAQEIAEGSEIPVLDIEKGYRVVLTPKTIAAARIITWQMKQAIGDSTQKASELLAQTLIDLAKSHEKFLLQDFHALLNNGFSTVLAPDQLSLFNASHEYASTGETFDNTLADQAFSVSTVDEIFEKFGGFTDHKGVPMELSPKALFVKKGGQASRDAKAVLGFNQGQYSPTSIGSINIYQGSDMAIVETPWITNGKAYYASADFDMANMKNPLYAGFINRPTLMPVHVDAATEAERINAMSYYKIGVVDMPYGWLGAEGTY